MTRASDAITGGFEQHIVGPYDDVSGTLIEDASLSQLPQSIGDAPGEAQSSGHGYMAGTVPPDGNDYGYLPRGIGARAITQHNFDLVVAASRDIHRNNEWCSGAIRQVQANCIGKGSQLSAATDDLDFNDAMDEEFEYWIGRVDPERKHKLGKYEGLAFIELCAAGTCQSYLSIAEEFKGCKEGPAIEIIEQERVPWQLEGETAKGNRVTQGMEYDSKNRHVATWMLTENPYEVDVFSIAGQFAGTVGKPIEESEHLKRLPVEYFQSGIELDHAGQVRGWPLIARAIRGARSELNYMRTVITQAQTAAGLGVIFEGVTSKELFGDKSKGSVLVDSMGNPIRNIRGSTVGFLKTGAKMHLAGTSAPGPQFQAVQKAFLRRLAAGLRASYESVSKDYSDTNFAGGRMSTDAERRVGEVVSDLIGDTIARPFYRGVVDHAMMNKLGRKFPKMRRLWEQNDPAVYAHEIVWPGASWVNPLQDAKAIREELDMGIISPQQACGLRGRSHKVVLRQRILAEKQEDRLREKLGAPRRDEQKSESAEERDRRDEADLKNDPEAEELGGNPIPINRSAEVA